MQVGQKYRLVLYMNVTLLKTRAKRTTSARQNVIGLHWSVYKSSSVAEMGDRLVTVKGKGKEGKRIYIAPFCPKVHTKHSGMDHTVLPANNTMPAFPS